MYISCNTHITTLSLGSIIVSVGVNTLFSLTTDPIIVFSGKFVSLNGKPTSLDPSFTKNSIISALPAVIHKYLKYLLF